MWLVVGGCPVRVVRVCWRCVAGGGVTGELGGGCCNRWFGCYRGRVRRVLLFHGAGWGCYVLHTCYICGGGQFDAFSGSGDFAFYAHGL